MTRVRSILMSTLLLTWPFVVEAESTRIDAYGFSILLPDGFAATQKDGGVQLAQTGMRRTVQRLEIFTQDQPFQTTMRQFTLRDVAGFDHPFLFTIEPLGAGSGGTEYRLTAVGTDNTSQTVVMIAQDQLEIGTPGFAFAWDILTSYQPR